MGVPVHLPPKPSVDLDALLEAREIDQKTYDRVKRLERVVTVTVLNRTTSIFGPLLMDEVRLPDGVMICKAQRHLMLSQLPPDHPDYEPVLIQTRTIKTATDVCWRCGTSRVIPVDAFNRRRWTHGYGERERVTYIAAIELPKLPGKPEIQDWENALAIRSLWRTLAEISGQELRPRNGLRAL